MFEPPAVHATQWTMRVRAYCVCLTKGAYSWCPFRRGMCNERFPPLKLQVFCSSSGFLQLHPIHYVIHLTQGIISLDESIYISTNMSGRSIVTIASFNWKQKIFCLLIRWLKFHAEVSFGGHCCFIPCLCGVLTWFGHNHFLNYHCLRQQWIKTNSHSSVTGIIVSCPQEECALHCCSLPPPPPRPPE